MKGAACVLALAVALASASGLWADEPQAPGRKPTWVERGLEVANPYVSAANDALGAAAGGVEASRALRASDISRSEGSRVVRKALAADYNALRTSGQGLVKAADRLGTATAVADVGGTLAGLVAEGDLRAVPGVVANAAAKNAVTAGGAWAGGGAGAMAGSVFGPVGTLIGGVIGAAAGAVGTSWGYDSASDALKRNGHHDVQSYVDSLTAEGPIDYVEKARQSRREWLAERAQADGLSGRQARPSGTEPTATTPPDTATASDAAIPVIPVDCAIDVVMWPAESPSIKWHGTFQVNGDTVTGRGEMTTSPGAQTEGSRQGPMHWTDEFAGTRRDNVISGTAHSTLQRTRHEFWISNSDGSGRRRCTLDFWGSNTNREEWTFLLGGQGQLRFSGQGSMTYQYASDCDKPGTTKRSSSASDEGKLFQFTWKIR